MTSPTTLSTTLLASILALLTPVQACPFCHKITPEPFVINWDEDIVIDADEDFIHLLQPIVGGRVRAAQRDSEGFPEDSLISVYPGWEDEQPAIHVPPGGEGLIITMHESQKAETLRRLQRGFARLSENGRLRTVHMSELERILSEELEYDAISWQEVTITAPPELAGTATRLAENLTSFIAGSVHLADKRMSGTEIRLSTHQAPAQVKASAKDKCIELKINPSDNEDTNLAPFLRALKEVTEEEKSPLSSVSEARLNRHFHEACRTKIIDWQHVILPIELGEDVADWFRRHADARVEFDNLKNESIEYNRHSLKVRMIYGARNREMGAWTNMMVGSTHIPTLTLTIAAKHKSPLSDTAYCQTVALQLLEWLRPLMKDGKLPALRVEELQEHLNKIRHPMPRP
ncbi:MAG: hypothetical protein IJB33_00395 [Akkermansia sp.]|nr:hypothetical protein [Akkermansia sp.]